MLLEIFSFVTSAIICAWCTYLIYDTFQNEPFMKAIKSIAADLAFLIFLGSYFTNNATVIVCTLTIIAGSCFFLFFGKRIENWFESKFGKTEVLKKSTVNTPKKAAKRKGERQPKELVHSRYACDNS